MAAFQFDPGFQRSLLRLMMVDDLFCLKAIQHCEASFFTAEPFGWIFGTFKAYWQEYRRTCTDVPLRGALWRVAPEKAALYHTEIEAVIACGGVPESDFVKAELADFCRRNLFSQAHQESARLFNGGKTVEAYDVMAKTQDELRKIDFSEIDRQWFFDEFPERQRQRYLHSVQGHSFATGITQLDTMTDGGVQYGEVWAVLAYAKRCKTTFLTNQGFNALRMFSAPVLHIQLEGRSDEITNKYEALFSNTIFNEVKKGNISANSFTSMQDEYRRKKKLLVVRTLNDWDVDILQVVAELDELKSYGFRPELLIIDYVDLLRSRYPAQSETQHQVDASRDLKRLVNTEKLACWTAWQAQRPAVNAHTNSHVLTSGSVADAYAKVRIVDAYGSLNATNEEMSRGEMRVFWEAHRQSPISKTWLIKNDLSMARMVSQVLGVSEPEEEEKKAEAAK